MSANSVGCITNIIIKKTKKTQQRGSRKSCGFQERGRRLQLRSKVTSWIRLKRASVSIRIQRKDLFNHIPRLVAYYSLTNSQHPTSTRHRIALPPVLVVTSIRVARMILNVTASQTEAKRTSLPSVLPCVVSIIIINIICIIILQTHAFCSSTLHEHAPARRMHARITFPQWYQQHITAALAIGCCTFAASHAVIFLVLKAMHTVYFIIKRSFI